MPLESGTRFGPYEIQSALGAGGMGEVYRARDKRLERDVAIKILPTHFTAGSRQLAQFEREARLLASLNHPNICSIYDVGTDRGISYIVMEHLVGETLTSRIERGPISVGIAIRYSVQIVDALRAAHSAGLVHRDIKPSNIMITTTGVKLLDFGLAKRSASDSSDQPPAGHTGETTRPSDLSQHEGIVGTLHYMAPEQLAGGDVDARSDIWAFGCVLYEMLTAKRAFSGQTFSDVIAGIMASGPITLTLERDVPPVALDHLLSRCLARNPSDRWRSSSELWRELLALLRQSPSDAPFKEAAVAPSGSGGDVRPPTARPTSASGDAGAASAADLVPPARRRTGLWFGLGTAVLLVGAGTGAWFSYLRPGRGAASSVAVLPFANADGAGAEAYLGPGIADGVSAELVRISKLRVVASRVASRAPQGSTLVDVGRALGVERLVSGRVTSHEDRIDVETQLVDAATGSPLWTGRYSEPLSGLPTLQREVIHGVLTALHLEQHAGDNPLVTVPSTLDAQAYRLILRGRASQAHATENGLRDAAALFAEAAAKDARSAGAQEGLARSYAELAAPMMAAMRPGDAFPRAKQAAMRAIELDPSLAEAHASLGVAKGLFDWDWQNAGAEFDRAVELDKGNPWIHQQRAEWLMYSGRAADAVSEAHEAVRLDPRSMTAVLTLGSQFYLTRQYTEAAEQANLALTIDPGAAAAHRLLGLAYEASGRPDDSLRELQSAAAASHDRPVYVAALAYGYARAGRQADARHALARLPAASSREYVSPFDVAIVLMGLDDREAAFKALQQAVEERAAGVATLACDPRFDRLRTDPRFRALQQRVGL